MSMRTICLPVAEVIDGGSKSEFYASVRHSLDASCRVANFAATECLRQDDRALTRCSKLYTYPIVKSLIPGATGVIANICRAVEKSYIQERWQVIHGIRASRSYRQYPWPLLRNKSSEWLRVRDAGEWLEADIRLADKWWTVRLASGSGHRDQIAGLRKAVLSDAIGDSKLWIDRKNKAMIGFSCDVPAKSVGNLSGEMRVASTIDHLLICTTARSSVPFAFNGDDVKRWSAESKRRYQRLRQDKKSGENKRRANAEMARLSGKQQRRFKDHVHKVSSQVVKKAVRARVAGVVIDLTIKSYIDSYPWHQLATAIAYKCEDAGISCVTATQSVTEPDISGPHVYFKYAPLTDRVKIGLTSKSDGSRHGKETDSSEALIILAIDNQPVSKLKSKERHYHALFAPHRVTADREWFTGKPVISWLRAAGWLGNSGNLSQISQFIDVSKDASIAGHLQPDSEWFNTANPMDCSHNAVQVARISGLAPAALAVLTDI